MDGLNFLGNVHYSTSTWERTAQERPGTPIARSSVLWKDVPLQLPPFQRTPIMPSFSPQNPPAGLFSELQQTQPDSFYIPPPPVAIIPPPLPSISRPTYIAAPTNATFGSTTLSTPDRTKTLVSPVAPPVPLFAAPRIPFPSLPPTTDLFNTSTFNYKPTMPVLPLQTRNLFSLPSFELPRAPSPPPPMIPRFQFAPLPTLAKTYTSQSANNGQEALSISEPVQLPSASSTAEQHSKDTSFSSESSTILSSNLAENSFSLDLAEKNDSVRENLIHNQEYIANVEIVDSSDPFTYLTDLSKLTKPSKDSQNFDKLSVSQHPQLTDSTSHVGEQLLWDYHQQQLFNHVMRFGSQFSKPLLWNLSVFSTYNVLCQLSTNIRLSANFQQRAQTLIEWDAHQTNKFEATLESVELLHDDEEIPEMITPIVEEAEEPIVTHESPQKNVQEEKNCEIDLEVPSTPTMEFVLQYDCSQHTSNDQSILNNTMDGSLSESITFDLNDTNCSVNESIDVDASINFTVEETPTPLDKLKSELKTWAEHPEETSLPVSVSFLIGLLTAPKVYVSPSIIPSSASNNLGQQRPASPRPARKRRATLHPLAANASKPVKIPKV